MGREIKVRFWNPYQKRMTAGKTLYELARNPVPTQCYDYEMQYTGLKDKNGVEIYEGDIVRSDFYAPDIIETAVIGYYEEESKFTFFNGRGDLNGEQDAFVLIMNGGLEVIGNIHQNPELLK